VQIVAGEAIRDIPHPRLQLDALAERLNVTGITYEEIPFSGELRPSNGGFTIVCSVHPSSARRRFTIAHELSHAIFEKSGSNCPRTGAELERLCDMLATELLMPRRAFLERCGLDPRHQQHFRTRPRLPDIGNDDRHPLRRITKAFSVSGARWLCGLESRRCKERAIARA
jgi:IrrE N-terminal-like domain